jgi:hypothetical protein
VEELTLGGFLYRYPWVIPVVLGFMIPLTGIVFGTLTGYWRRTRQAELDAALKQQMLERGMSADEIVQVLEARSQPFKVGCHERRSVDRDVC